MSAIIILEAEVRDKEHSTLLNLLSQYLPETRNYKGFIDISIHTQEKENKILFYQEWESIEDYESYLQWRTETGVMETLGATFMDPPRIRYFRKENI